MACAGCATPQDLLRTQRLEFRDPHGSVRTSLGEHEEGSLTLYFFNPQGKDVAGLGMIPQWAARGELYLSNAQGITCSALTLSRVWAGLDFADWPRGGYRRLAISCSTEGDLAYVALGLGDDYGQGGLEWFSPKHAQCWVKNRAGRDVWKTPFRRK
ncbi:MAG: hypothetical protein IT452_03425 [Planctomycetia bacterium]|nr:hypothetical protein [Planctomycetia bacterium]